MKKFAVFDLDGTVYRGTLTFDVVEELIQRFEFVSERAQVEQAMKQWKERDSLDSYWRYNEAVAKVFENVLANVRAEDFKAAVQHVLDTRKKYRYTYTTDLIARLKLEGRILIAMSGSITEIVEPFAQSLGFDIIFSSQLEIIDGKYSGKRATHTSSGKDVKLREIIAENKLSLEDSIGVGDTHRDISMLAVVERAIAFNPNVALYEEASRRGWKIIVERKNMVFEMVKEGERYIVESAHPSHAGPHDEHVH